MTGAIDRAKAHYDRVGRRRIEVPEWGDPAEKNGDGDVVKPARPFLIFSTPMTIFERRKCSKPGASIDIEMYVSVVMLKAKDKDGKALFSEEGDDRHDLLCKVDGAIVTRIALDIMAGPTPQDLEKN